MTIEDRFTMGFLAGVVASTVMNIFSSISYTVNWGELRFLDWSGVYIFGHQPQNTVEVVMSLTGQMLFSALAGSFFAYFIANTTSKNYIFKGLVYGLSIWFLTYSIGVLFRTPTLKEFNLNTVTSNFTGAVIYGLVLPLTLKWLNDRVKT